jgi:aldose 1-epimerase
MQFLVERMEREAGGVPRRVFVLSSEDLSVQAEIWPDLGCNCLRWRVPGPTGPLELLYSAPDWETNPVPTRSGIPILFPFPNRIRDGRFTWNGRQFEQPPNDPAHKNSIHGFVCHHSWHVRNSSGKNDLATFTAEFQACADAAPEFRLWPGDYKLTMRYLLGPDSLSLSATINNPGQDPIPVGLGYHPYFRIPFVNHASSNECLVSVPANSAWELVGNLPSGKKTPVDSARDLRKPRSFSELHLDDLLTDFVSDSPEHMLQLRGSIHQPTVGTLEIWTSNRFREMVVFTPPHREAICLEPYTCTTDAINLEQQGVDAGLTVLNPGETRTEFVVLRFNPAKR